MPDYSKGKIYKIVNNVNDKVYYGSTTQPLSHRMGNHRKKNYNCTSKKLDIDIKECKIILVENYSCNSKYELESRERYYIENFDCVNKQIPTRTINEYLDENKDILKEKSKKYREKNKDIIKQRKTIYYQNNKDKINENKKKWREENKDKIDEKNKKIIKCQCGSEIQRMEISRHKKTKKHLNFISQSKSTM